MVCVWAWRYYRDRSRLNLITTGLIAVPAAAAVLALVRITTIRQGHLAESQPWFVEAGAILRVIGSTFSADAFLLDSWAGWAGLIVALVVTAAGFWRARLGTDDRLTVAALVFGSQVLGFALGCVVFGMTVTSFATVRYVGLAAPAAAVVAAYGLEMLFGRRALAAFLAVVALQMTQLRIGEDRKGMTPRKLAALAAGSAPVVAVRGHGRGVPASVAYELRPDNPICVLQGPEACRDLLSGALIVESTPTVSADVKELEREFIRDCRGCRSIVMGTAQ